MSKSLKDLLEGTDEAVETTGDTLYKLRSAINLLDEIYNAVLAEGESGVSEISLNDVYAAVDDLYIEASDNYDSIGFDDSDLEIDDSDISMDIDDDSLMNDD